ncbi:hypothetical protein ABZ312_11410 [Streptomyces sp. NPDC006207]
MADKKTDEDVQRDAYAAALKREREGYVLRGLSDRVSAVDAELKRLGVAAPSTEPRETAAESKPRRTAAQARGRKTD